MSKGKRGVITQHTMLVKINLDIMSELIEVPGWGQNKNGTINRLLRYALDESQKSREKQLKLEL